MIKINKNLWGSIIFLLLATIIWLLIPYQIASDTKRIINSQTFPRLVIGIMWVFSLVLLIKTSILILRKQDQSYIVINAKEESISWMMIGSIVLFWVLLHWLSFIISAMIFATIVLLIFRSKKWYYYGITYTTIVIVTLVFENILKVKLP